MPEVAALGYVVVSAADLESWSAFGERLLGLQASGSPPVAPSRQSLFFRMDERAWRIAVEQGEDDGLVALGFEVASPGDLTRLVGKLEAAGCSTKDAPGVADERGVTHLVQAADPSGLPLEFFCGAPLDRAAFVSPTGVRFVTGSMGFGHAVVTVDDVEEANAFYVDLLGFRLSDTVSLLGIELFFTSPNRRHHSLAYSLPPPGASAAHLEHIMIEVDDLDAVGRAADYCLDNDIPVRAMLGKHSNDHMVSFYCVSPSGLTVEYGWGGRQIDDATHQIGRYDHPHYWGHRLPDGRDPVAEMRKMLEAARPGDND
jgi:3,4-dihydroxy-9,10-secoandrosta-1,3,5(10)-triene-9,17-dione 4,5-dioxygenase